MGLDRVLCESILRIPSPKQRIVLYFSSSFRAGVSVLSERGALVPCLRTPRLTCTSLDDAAVVDKSRLRAARKNKALCDRCVDGARHPPAIHTLNLPVEPPLDGTEASRREPRRHHLHHSVIYHSRSLFQVMRVCVCVEWTFPLQRRERRAGLAARGRDEGLCLASKSARRTARATSTASRLSALVSPPAPPLTHSNTTPG